MTSRSEAKLLGLTKYFTGKPCRHGHTDERFTSSGACVTCALARTRQYRSDDPDHARELNKKYKKKHAEEISRRSKERYRANAVKITERKRLNYKANVDAMREQDRAYYARNRLKRSAAKAAYRRDNPEKVLAAWKRWYKKNLSYYRIANTKRRAAENQRIPPWFGEFDKFVMSEAAELSAQRKLTTGLNWHVDHMIPMRAKEASGLHCAHNLQVIPDSMNLSKHNRLWLDNFGDWIMAL